MMSSGNDQQLPSYDALKILSVDRNEREHTNSSCPSCETTVQPQILTSRGGTREVANGMQNTVNAVKGIIIITLQRGEPKTNALGVANSHSIANVLIRKDVIAYIRDNSDVSSDGSDNLPTIEILDKNDTVIYSTKFSYQEVMTVPMQMPGQIDDTSPSQVQITPFATVILPYPAEGKRIRIIDENGRMTDITSLENYEISDQNSTSIDSKSLPSNPGSFNLLILASGYTSANMDKFIYTAELIEKVICEAEPFKSKIPSISVNIYPNTKNVGCYTGCSGIDRLLCCDSTKVISAALDSGTLFDEIIVVHNTDIYAGSGSRDLGLYKTNSYDTSSKVYGGDYSAIMALHEFGHSFGNLCDEYTYSDEGYEYYPCVNCRASCSAWSSFSSICTRSCDARSDFFRPDNSVMFSLSYRTYNQASIKASYSPDGLEKRLNYFLIKNVNPVPHIMSIRPSRCSRGSPEFMLQVTGKNFVEGARVRWNGVLKPTTFVSATYLKAKISASDVKSKKTVVVSVTNPSPGGGKSNSKSFVVT
jgi:hypothetical protein